MLPIKKLYIDSRFKSPDSVSDADFYIDMPQTTLMPEGTGFYLDDISIPVSWYPIEKGVNNKLYVEVSGTLRVIEIDEGNITTLDLSKAIRDKINQFFSDMRFSVSSTYSKATETITFESSSGRTWKILTDPEIELKGTHKPFASLNKVLGNYTPKLNTTDWKTGYVNLFPLRNIYITSYGLGNFNTMTISGERAVVKKVPVTANYGEFIFDQNVVGIDYLDCSKQTLSRIGFRLCNIYGETINLHGMHWSFSIVFSRIQELN
jgi:hypothetical protein